MDARDALRRYLEQRREQGESELVLDTLSVEDALRLIGAPASSQSSPSSQSPSPSRANAKATERAVSADWRQAIRDAGGAAAPSTTAQELRPEEAPVAKHDAGSTNGVSPESRQGGESPLADVPAGLSVGSGSRVVVDHPGAALQTLEEIATMIASCTRCALYETAKNPVPGSGNPIADFMCVGEAPGANEDEQGVPFVGQAGQLLTKILEAIQLKREDVFIANVLKHRPPGNRNPQPDEVVACSPYLVRQIELVQPKVILALGTFAAQTLLETKLTIGKLRGQIHRYHGVPLVVTYHPAALLRNPAWKRPTWEDVQLARRILDSASLSS
jgi:uracil-DNA glycosylase